MKSVNSERCLSRPNLLYWGAVAVTLLGFALRIHALGRHSFWIDELLTVRSARGPFGDIFAVRDHPPLLYFVTSVSLDLFGESEFTARLPALFAGTLAMPLLLALGKELRKAPAGLCAAFLLAFSPLHLHHSQEARHYPWLLLFSLVSYILLHRALTHASEWRWWLLFALATILNLYTHYGALVVLASQTLIISTWLIFHLLSRRSVQGLKHVLYPAAAAIVVMFLYLPWIPHLLVALNYNVGPEASTKTGGVTPVSQWLLEVFHSFSLHPQQASVLTLLLCVLGVVVWFKEGDRKNLVFTLAALALPFLPLAIGDISRGAYGRYIIYLLPLYLLFAGVFLSFFLRATRSINRVVSGMSVTLLVLGMFVIGGAAAAQEYESENSDWRGILHYLDARAAEEDILIMMSLNYPDGFNTVSAAFPYYLSRHQRPYQKVKATSIQLEDALALNETDRDVWVVVDNWIAQEQIRQLPLKVVPFASQLFVVGDSQQEGLA